MTHEQFLESLQLLGLKQADYARLIEVSQKTVWTWAAGRVPVPGVVARHLEVLAALNALHAAHVLGLKPAPAVEGVRVDDLAGLQAAADVPPSPGDVAGH
jgi:transcriptional regulator with XRE-family HTH domain